MNDSEKEPAKVALKATHVWKVFGANAKQFRALPEEEREAAVSDNPDWTAAVRDVSFSVMRGEVFVIMGLSGSGKSTLVRSLTRLNEPSSGEILFDGDDISAMSNQDLITLRRRRMGMVFQHFALLPHRTVAGNIAFPLDVQGMDKQSRDKRVESLVKTVGLDNLAHRYPAELSGGQQQRVGIARSLATDPDYWFLDEPFSALDPLIRSDLQLELLRLQATLGKTVVFITHDLDEAIRIADRIMILEGGRVAQIGTPEALVKNPATDYVKRFVASVPRAKVVTAGSLMESNQPARLENIAAVDQHSTIASIALRVVESDTDLPVQDAEGMRVGVLSRKAALRVLADVPGLSVSA